MGCHVAPSYRDRWTLHFHRKKCRRKLSEFFPIRSYTSRKRTKNRWCNRKSWTKFTNCCKQNPVLISRTISQKQSCAGFPAGCYLQKHRLLKSIIFSSKETRKN